VEDSKKFQKNTTKRFLFFFSFHRQQNFCVNISCSDYTQNILPRRSPPLCVASKRRQDLSGGPIERTHSLPASLSSPPLQSLSSTQQKREGEEERESDPENDPYPPSLSSLISSLPSGNINQKKKQKLTVDEWLSTVIRVTEEMRWNETVWDEKSQKEFVVSTGNPNPIIEQLCRTCPIDENHFLN
jgi:hypothetical protein